jgi:hypothetical protein
MLELPSDLWMRLRRNGDTSLAFQLQALGVLLSLLEVARPPLVKVVPLPENANTLYNVRIP